MIKFLSHEEAFTQAYEVFQEKVMLFNSLAGNEVTDKTLIPIYIGLLQEELQEFIEAETVVDTLDGIVDVMIVGEFLLRLYGYEKGLLSGINGLRGMGNPDELLADANYLMTEISKESPCGALIFSNLQLLVLGFIGSAVDHHVFMNEIADSNLSKFIPQHAINHNQAQEECNKIEELGRYKGVTFMMMNGYYIFKDENGKVVKPPSFFKEPDLHQYL